MKEIKLSHFYLGYPRLADIIIEMQGYLIGQDDESLKSVIKDVLLKNEKSIQEYRSGKEKALSAIIGQVMRITQGRLSPQKVTESIKSEIEKGS